MRLLILLGEENSGKTTVLKKLITYLKAYGYTFYPNNLEYKSLHNPERDVEVIMKKKGHLSIGVYTMGDDNKYYRKCLENNDNLDVLVLSQRINIRILFNEAIKKDCQATFVLKEKNDKKKDMTKSDRKHCKFLFNILKLLK